MGFQFPFYSIFLSALLCFSCASSSDRIAENRSSDKWFVESLHPEAQKLDRCFRLGHEFAKTSAVIHPVFSVRIPDGWSALYSSCRGKIVSTEMVKLVPSNNPKETYLSLSIGRSIPNEMKSIEDIEQLVTKEGKKSQIVKMGGRTWVSWVVSADPEAQVTSYSTIEGPDVWNVLLTSKSNGPADESRLERVRQSIRFTSTSPSIVQEVE